MKTFEDNEIIKALNYCCGNIGYNDEECNKDMCYQVELPENRDGDIRWCKQWLVKDALDLINRKNEEIERLLQKLQQAQIEARQELIKRLKEDVTSIIIAGQRHYVIVETYFDNLVKEMTEVETIQRKEYENGKETM